jgi:RNA polymerase sigma-70 factor, ECF subfamily
MLYSPTSISDILLPQGAMNAPTNINSYEREKAHSGMTVEKSAQQQDALSRSDEAALVQLYERFRRPIHSYSFRLLGSQEDADDVTQEVFIRAFTSWQTLSEHEHLSSWLYRIATNLCVDILRRRKRISWRSLNSRRHGDESSSEENLANDISSFLADDGGIPDIAEREVIRLTLAALPMEYSVVLVLHAAQGIPYQEIAQIVGVSPNAAATRISRAKKMFAQQYQKLNASHATQKGKKA